MDFKGSYVQAVALAGLESLMEQGGLDPRDLLEEVGIPREAIDQPEMLISHRAHAHLLEICAHRLGNPALGLVWAENLPPRFTKVAPLAILAYFAKDAREWLGLIQTYLAFHTNGARIELRDCDAGHVALRYIGDSFAYPSRQLVEHVLALCCLLGRHVTGHMDERPSLVCFRHSRPKDTSAHARIFECDLRFDAEQDEIVFERRYLDFGTNGNLRLFRPLVEYYLRYRIDRMKGYDQSMATTVALALPGMLGTSVCDADFVAAVLGMSAKKMQRLLAAEGTTFSEILENVRQNMARQLMAESKAPVAQIAGMLGYAAASPFIVAFRRWTGRTPLQYRRNERQETGLTLT